MDIHFIKICFIKTFIEEKKTNGKCPNEEKRVHKFHLHNYLIKNLNNKNLVKKLLRKNEYNMNLTSLKKII